MSRPRMLLLLFTVAAAGALGLVVTQIAATVLRSGRGSGSDSNADSGWHARWIGDVDGDGATDVLITTGARRRSPPVSLLVSGRDGSRIEDAFGLPRPRFAHREVHVLGDLDGNGRIEVAWDAGGRLFVRDAGGAIRSFARTAGGMCAPISDLDGDGALDLAIEGFGPSSDAVGRLSAVSTRTGATLWSVERNARPPRTWSDFARSGCALGDVDGDGSVDLAVHEHDESVAWISGRDGRTIRDVDVTSSPSPASLARHGDLDGDGLPELLVAAPGHGWVRILAGSDGSELAAVRASVPYSDEFSPSDVDGDGRDDVAWTTGAGGEVVRTSDGACIAFFGGVRLGPGRGEVDGDGHADLLLVRNVRLDDPRATEADLWRLGRVEVVSGRTRGTLCVLDADVLGL